MDILVACEESQRVCIEFRKKGHRAYSCDIQECSGGHPEWHIKGDVLSLLNGNCVFTLQNGVTIRKQGKWDMIIAFPPCTHLAVSGARHFAKKRQDGRQREGIEFFCKFLSADCSRIVIENPVGIISGNYIVEHFPDLAKKYNLPQKPSQIIQPWMFGDHYSKATCLWIKGLPKLVPMYTEQPTDLAYVSWVDKRTGKIKRQPKWYVEALKLSASERQKVRSKTFPAVAKAMADAWGGVSINEI